MNQTKNINKLVSLAVVFCMVISGLAILGPSINTIVPMAPETVTFATAGEPLPPGDLPAHQDGVAGDGHDILIIVDYFTMGATPTSSQYSGGWDASYAKVGTLVDDIHYHGYTVDTWYCYPHMYSGGYKPGSRQLGYYDSTYRYNYYPVDSKGYPDTIDSYNDYRAVLIMSTSGYLYFGMYNYAGNYESAQPTTAQRSLEGLEEYAANGGSLLLTNRNAGYDLYYNYYIGSRAVQTNVKARVGLLFDCTANTYNRNPGGSGYSWRGYPGTTPNTGDDSIGFAVQDYDSIWGKVGPSEGGWVSVKKGDRLEALYGNMYKPFSDAADTSRAYMNYQYSYYHQRPVGDGIQCMEHSYYLGANPSDWRGAIDGVQSDHGGDYKSVILFSGPWYQWTPYITESGDYVTGPGIIDSARLPLMGSILNYLIGDVPDCDPEIAAVNPVEVQSSASANEWIELVTTIGAPVNLYNYSIGIGAGPDKPSSYFGGYEDLGEFGVPADLMDHTYYMNAEDLYVDTYWADGTGTYNNFYLYKVSKGNEYGKYYHLGSGLTNWWDSNDQTFLTEDEKDSKSLSYLEDYIYQVSLPQNWWMRHQYIRLNTGDTHKYENNQVLRSTNTGGTYLDIDFEAMVDPAITPNTETQALMDYWAQMASPLTIKSSTLDDYYVYDSLTFGYRLYLYDDNDGTSLGYVNMPTSSHFWKITSLPYGGTIFVNDNNPTTTFYFSHFTGAQVGASGENIQEIDLTNNAHFEHYTNELYFEDGSRTYGSTTIDFTSANIQNQITTVTLTAPILTDTVFVNKNSGAFSGGPAGGDIVEISLDLLPDDFSYLFPRGATYRDYTTAGAPSRDLDHIIVVDDSQSDIDGNKNELVANGQIRMWHHGMNDYDGAAVGWGTNGPAPEPAGGMSAQAFFDGSKYRFGSYWTLGAESKGVDNSVAAPAYGSVDVVINEINPSFVELYNRGGSGVNMNGWKLTGEGNSFSMSGSIAPGGFKVITESDFYIPFTPGTGGRVSLFDDIGALVSSIGYQTEVPGNQYSYTQRHIDGVGPDYGYNDSQLTLYAMDGMEAQPNEDWVMGEARSTGTGNYDGLTILQIGAINDSPWSLIENLSMYNPDWAAGTIGTKKIDQYYLNNFDVIFCVGGLTAASSGLLNDYLLDGGRLYVEYGDWSTLAATDLYQTLGIEASNAANSPVSLIGVEPVTGGIDVAYSDSTSSKFTPNSETFRVLEEGGTTYAVLHVDIDTSNPGNSYRAVASAVKYEKMSPMTRSELYDYTGMIMDYFLRSDDAVNHAPVIELKDPIPNPEIPLYKSRPNLLWQNKDIDVWDQVPGTMEYTLYIDTNHNKVTGMDPDARSSVFVQETATATMVDALDAPVAGIYYWGIFAEDKYGKTTYVTGGAFKYDSETPNVDSMSAMSGDTMDDPLPIGITRVFGPGYMNSQGDTIGRPDGFAIDLSDNFGLKFSNNNRVAEQLFMDEYFPPTTAFSVKVLYFYGGQYEDDLPNFNMYVDMMGTNNDLESLTGMDDVTFYVIPDGPIPDGQYHFYIQSADEVRWGSYMDWTFEVDLSAPETPIDIMIDPETYVDQFDDLYLKAGETYTLSAWAPSSSEDGSMNRVEFQQAVANYPGATWETIGADYDVTDNVYSVVWTPDTAHFYLRAIAYDYVENFAVSDVVSSFHVDGAGPEAPLTLQATLDLTHTPVAKLSGYVYDRIIEGQTSGVDYVVIWHYDDASGTMELVTDDQDQVLMVPVIDFQFDVDVSLDAITGATGDLSYAYYAQAYDHVGNVGDMSDIATWTNTGMEEALRVISPSSIKDIPMGMDVENMDDSLDEVRSITVTFLNTEQDFMNYQFTIRGQQLRTASQAADLGLPAGTKFLYNYFNVEVPPEFTNFEAQVTIEFHISQRSQLGTRSSEILENIRLVTKHSGENSFEVLDLIGGQAQPVDEAKGLYRVQARVNRFSDFAVIVAQTDLTVKDIILGANPAISGQGMSITVTVHNGGDFPKDADNVRVKLFTIDEDGNQEYIGELDYGTIDAEKDYYLSDSYLRKGDKQATLYWTTSELLSDGEIQAMTIRAQVDPDGYVREVSETNNEKTTMVEIVGSAQSSPSFELTFMLMALGVMLVSGMSVFIRKKD